MLPAALMLGLRGVTVIEQLAGVTLLPTELVPLSENVVVPPPTGTPVIFPVAPIRESPLGSAPVLTE